MSDTSALARAFAIQADACIRFGSPFSGALLALARSDIEADGTLPQLLAAAWGAASTRSLVADAVAIRWLGAAHDLALSGEFNALAAAYPTRERPEGDAPAAWAAASALMAETPGRFLIFMAHEPQTNEVRRSACLAPGFLTVAGETGLPLRLFEIGASAGLNQLWDRYAYDYGEAGSWGDAGSPVKLDTVWTGGPAPTGGNVHVISRAACDRKPVDLRDTLSRRRLRAYVWADQFDRLARLDAAVSLALIADVRVEAEDAVTWTARRAVPTPGAATVVYHSVFWQYMPSDSQAALASVIETLGARAERTSPFAWLRMEPRPDNLATVELRLTTWPGGEDRLLARVHPHGAFVDWLG